MNPFQSGVVNSEGFAKQLGSDKLTPPKKGEGKLAPQDGALVGDDDGDLNVDEATKPSHVNALKPCIRKIPCFYLFEFHGILSPLTSRPARSLIASAMVFKSLS